MLKVRGSLLIECLIALSLSVLLLDTLFTIYLHIITASKNIDAVLELNEKSDQMNSILKQALLSAGNLGCKKMNTIQNMGKTFFGEDHAVTVKYMKYPYATILKNMLDYQTIYTNQAIRFSRNQILIIADCETAEIVTVATVTNEHGMQRIVLTQPVKNNYLIGASIGVFKNDRYHLKSQSFYVNDNEYGDSALMEGIEDISFKYSVLENGQIVDENAAVITDWSTVKGVQWEVTVASAGINKKEYAYVALR